MTFGKNKRHSAIDSRNVFLLVKTFRMSNPFDSCRTLLERSFPKILAKLVYLCYNDDRMNTEENRHTDESLTIIGHELLLPSAVCKGRKLRAEAIGFQVNDA